jgi:hypothetical protein
MQQKTINNLIINIFTACNNKQVKHYFIIKKASKQVKHIKLVNKLSNIYNALYKYYKCNNKQLNLIQFVYSTNCYKQTTYAYNLAQRNAIKKALANI